jgi:hypothetical protein
MSIKIVDENGEIIEELGDDAVLICITADRGMHSIIPKLGDDESTAPEHVVFGAALGAYASTEHGAAAIFDWFEGQIKELKEEPGA